MATQNNLAKRSVSVSALAQDPLAAVAQGVNGLYGRAGVSCPGYGEE